MKKFFEGKWAAKIVMVGLVMAAATLCFVSFKKAHDTEPHEKGQTTDQPAKPGTVYSVGDYLNLQLPEGLSLGTFQTEMNGIWQGCFLEGDFEEMLHDNYCPEAWHALGGIGVTEKQFMPPGSPFFEDGELKSVELMLNAGGCVSGYEKVEGCQMQAILGEYWFDLFNALEWQEYCEENNLPEEEFWELPVSNYWYIFFADEDSEYVYELFLNQKYFDRDEAIEMAKTVVFSESPNALATSSALEPIK